MPPKFQDTLSQKEHGFTLIELIIVVVIIAILAMIAIPRYFSNLNILTKSKMTQRMLPYQE